MFCLPFLGKLASPTLKKYWWNTMLSGSSLLTLLYNMLLCFQLQEYVLAYEKGNLFPGGGRQLGIHSHIIMCRIRV
jgi:hypothetical protein